MSDHKGEELKLLALVHDNFAENGPRLDYADWLDREGRSEAAPTSVACTS